MKRKNTLKEHFLANFPEALIDNVVSKFQDNLCFSFQFFNNAQEAGQDFSDWEHEHLYKLLDKLKHYCNNTMIYWLKMPAGGGKNHVLEIYGHFPKYSDFEHPKNVPLDVDWARFRLEGDMRLIGFVVKKETCERLSIYPNTFYIVFLDRSHRFYKTVR